MRYEFENLDFLRDCQSSIENIQFLPQLLVRPFDD